MAPEDMEDQNIIILDMRLHTRVHLAGISVVTKNRARAKKDTKETVPQAYIKKLETTEAENDGKLVGPPQKVRGFKMLRIQATGGQGLSTQVKSITGRTSEWIPEL